MLVTLCTLALCLSFAGITSAYKEGYIAYTIFITGDVTIDGKWTNDNEWENSTQTHLWTPIQNPFGTNCFFNMQIGSGNYSPSSLFYEVILIENLNDNTTNIGDYWEICLDSSGNGGLAPQNDDYKMQLIGHNTTNWYRGNGTAWEKITTPPAAVFEWKDSISPSPKSSNSHYICEAKIQRNQLSIAELDFGLRVAVYDADNTTYGVQAWLLTLLDMPNEIGEFR